MTELPGGSNAEAHPRGNWVDTADLNDRKASIVGNGKAITNSHLAIGVFLNPRIVNKNWPPPFTKTFALENGHIKIRLDHLPVDVFSQSHREVQGGKNSVEEC